jgi:hypothetical protein
MPGDFTSFICPCLQLAFVATLRSFVGTAFPCSDLLNEKYIKWMGGEGTIKHYSGNLI